MIQHKLYRLLLFLLLGYAAQAQDKTSGIIYYKQTVNLKAIAVNSNGTTATAEAPAGLPALPDKTSAEYELIFNAGGAKFQKTYTENQGGGMMIVMAGGPSGNRKIYFDQAQQKTSELITIDGDEYVMQSKLGSGSDTVEKSDETKQIIGYTCKKVAIKNKGIVTTIWYTTDLKISASPAVPYWTEGVVLAMENPRTSYLATSVEYYKVKDNEVKAPKNAKPITPEEYKAKMDEQMKRMQSSGGGGRVFRFGN